MNSTGHREVKQLAQDHAGGVKLGFKLRPDYGSPYSSLYTHVATEF